MCSLGDYLLKLGILGSVSSLISVQGWVTTWAALYSMESMSGLQGIGFKTLWALNSPNPNPESLLFVLQVSKIVVAARGRVQLLLIKLRFSRQRGSVQLCGSKTSPHSLARPPTSTTQTRLQMKSAQILNPEPYALNPKHPPNTLNKHPNALFCIPNPCTLKP